MGYLYSQFHGDKANMLWILWATKQQRFVDRLCDFLSGHFAEDTDPGYHQNAH